MPLFKRGRSFPFGIELSLKIECDALCNEDIEHLPRRSVKNYFQRSARRAARGLRLAEALARYRSRKGITLLVDDVLTTGASMKRQGSALIQCRCCRRGYFREREMSAMDFSHMALGMVFVH